MLLNILLLSILFIAALCNLFFYIPTKKLYAWLQSIVSSSSAITTTSSKPSLSTIKEEKINGNNKDEKTSNNHTSELRKVFATFDKNSDGFITKQELRESLKNIRIVLSEEEVEEMITKLDSNGDGLIDFEEFGSLCESMVGDHHHHEEREVINMKNRNLLHHDDIDHDEELKEAFDVFDMDKDGLISFEELGSILASLGLSEGKRAENCKAMINKVDEDGDGMVNFQEFKSMMKGNNLLLSSS